MWSAEADGSYLSYHTKQGGSCFPLFRRLATNQLLLPRHPAKLARIDRPSALTTPETGDLLVARIDAWFLAIDQVSVGIDDRFAIRTFDIPFDADPEDQAANLLGAGL